MICGKRSSVTTLPELPADRPSRRQWSRRRRSLIAMAASPARARPAQRVHLRRENTDLIIPLGTWVLQTAVRQATQWPADKRVSVNMSTLQLLDDSLVDEVRATLAATDLEPDRLVLEITETTLAADLESVAAQLGRLKALGIRLALDDFGTGYSSLAYLQHFPLAALPARRAQSRQDVHRQPGQRRRAGQHRPGRDPAGPAPRPGPRRRGRRAGVTSPGSRPPRLSHRAGILLRGATADRGDRQADALRIDCCLEGARGGPDPRDRRAPNASASAEARTNDHTAKQQLW